jgi:nitrite reductase/ring-hydroxylating ferredoxin subunit
MAKHTLPMPNGWFMVAFSGDVARGQIKGVRAMGKDLAVFRGESGAVGVLDAYCAHLGANLAVGGCVEADSVKCPFHAWRWDTAGKCVDIPYSDRIPPGARTKSYPVDEVNGQIYIWHHSEDKAPFYQVPKIEQYGDDDWTSDWVRYDWTLNSHPQEIMENAIDWPHFMQVHKMDQPSNRKSIFDGYMFHWIIDAGFSQNQYGESEALKLHGENYGLGFNLTRYNGAQQTISVGAITPIDCDRLSFINSVIGKKNGRGNEEVMVELRAQMEEQAKVVLQDFPIWENKMYRERPILCANDGPILEYRRWAKQFYSEPVA